MIFYFWSLSLSLSQTHTHTLYHSKWSWSCPLIATIWSTWDVDVIWIRVWKPRKGNNGFTSCCFFKKNFRGIGTVHAEQVHRNICTASWQTQKYFEWISAHILSQPAWPTCLWLCLTTSNTFLWNNWSWSLFTAEHSLWTSLSQFETFHTGIWNCSPVHASFTPLPDQGAVTAWS